MIDFVVLNSNSALCWVAKKITSPGSANIFITSSNINNVYKLVGSSYHELIYPHFSPLLSTTFIFLLGKYSSKEMKYVCLDWVFHKS